MAEMPEHKIVIGFIRDDFGKGALKVEIVFAGDFVPMSDAGISVASLECAFCDASVSSDRVCMSVQPLSAMTISAHPVFLRLKECFPEVFVLPHWGKGSEYTRYPVQGKLRLKI